MKNIILSLAVIATTIASVMGQSVVKTYNFSNITAIDASYTYNITATKGRSNNVTVVYPAYLEEYITLTSIKGTLKLDVNTPRNFRTPKNASNAITVRMEMETIKNIQLSGASSFKAEGSFTTESLTLGMSGASQSIIEDVSGRQLRVGCSGASKMRMGGKFDKATFDCSGASNTTITGDMADIQAEISGATRLLYKGASNYVLMDISGASTATLKGSTKQLEADCSGASVINSKELIAENVNVDVSGASTANVYVSGIFKAQATGGSSINYCGNPKQIITELPNIRKVD